jgi:hypothetical protein
MNPSFCPHCGEDLRPLQRTEGQPAQPALAQAPARKVVQREVPRNEIEAIWGLMPMPFGVRPIGVVVEGDNPLPAAIAAEATDGKLIELKMGQTKLLDLTAADGGAQPTQHLCSNMLTPQAREDFGAKRYGCR